MMQIQKEFFDGLKQANTKLTPDNPWEIFNKTFPTDLEVYLHYHESLEINYSQEVIGTIRIGNNTLELQEHPVIIIPPNTLHSYKICRNSGAMLVVHISLQDLQNYLVTKQIFSAIPLRPDFLPATSPDYTGLIPVLTQLATVKKPVEKIIETLRMFTLLGDISPDELPISSQNSKLNRIVAYTEQHFAEKLTLDQISAECNFSKAYFCRYFKKHAGITYWEYLNFMRLEHAKHMLMQGASVSEACFSSGFDDLSYFIKLFKKRMGFTPGRLLTH